MKRVRVAVLVSSVLLCGCPGAWSDPPPPPRKPEIPTAPPHALGALAAGTDAAPRPYTTLPGSDGEPVAPPAAPPPVAPDGGVPDAGPSPKTGAPDAGMAL
jgi:hypothetical protein